MRQKQRYPRHDHGDIKYRIWWGTGGLLGQVMLKFAVLLPVFRAFWKSICWY